MSLRSDLTYAVRTLVRSRLTTVAIVATIALGIGANTAVFSIVYGILLRPLPFPEPAELMQLWLSNPRQGIERDITSYPNFADWRARSRSFESMAGVSSGRAALTGSGPAEEIPSASVTVDYFRVLGVQPLLGRVPTAEEAMNGAAPVVVISEELWRSRFGSNPEILSRTIELNGTARQVLGVMPAGIGEARVWTPLEQSPAFPDLREARGALFLPVIGRLREGVGPEAAQRELSAIAAQLETEYPNVNESMGVLVEPLRDAIVGDVRSALVLLLCAVGVVLLIACANVANVLLARSTARRREMAVRVALGAGRLQLLRQVMTENLVLTLLGAAIGVGVASWTLDLLVASAPAGLPRLEDIRLDTATLLFTAGIALFAALLFGAAPAWEIARREPGVTLGSGARGTVEARDRVRTALVVAQYALAVVLVAGAALLVRSFAALQDVDMGMEPEGVLSFALSPSPARYDDGPEVRAYYDEVISALESTAGVESVALVGTVFQSRLPNMAAITPEGAALPPELERMPVAYDPATPGLLSTLRMGLLRGRGIDRTDRADGPNVAVVNETFVRLFFPDRDPIGGRFSFGQVQSEEDWITIVGVVEDARRSGPAADVRPYIFAPFAQLTPRRMTVLVRAAAEPLALVPTVRAAVTRIDEDVPIAEMRLLQDDFDAAISTRRFLMMLITGFGLTALVLAAIGVYGVMAYVVGRRTREIGVRIALGARPSMVRRQVVGRGVGQAAVGVAAGLGATVLLADLLRAHVFRLSPTDPTTLGAVALLLLGLAAAASWLPARRAAAVDPLVALSAD